MTNIIKYEVRLLGGRSGETISFAYDEDEIACTINCIYRDEHIDATASDYFEALCEIRLILEGDGLLPICYGASLNVYPSGMGRDMAAGLKAYFMTMGRHARISDLVEIFDTSPSVEPSTVAQQKQFFADWLASERL